MATTTLTQSLLAFQAEGVKLQKNAINPHFKNRYIGLDSLMADVLPVLNKCGLVVLQMPCSVDGVPSLTTRIVHGASGEAVESTMPLMLTKQDPQSMGAALTYARRYALMAVLGLVADEDTDGHTPARRSAGASAGNAGAAREAPAGGAAPAPTADGYATEAQRKRLFAIKKSVGITDGELRAIINAHTGQESTAQIPRDKYEAVCAAVEAWRPVEVPFE